MIYIIDHSKLKELIFLHDDVNLATSIVASKTECINHLFYHYIFLAYYLMRSTVFLILIFSLILFICDLMCKKMFCLCIFE